MNIGLNIYGSLDTISGGYLYDRKLVEHLQEQGHEVRIISLPWRNYLSHLGDNFSSRWKNQLRDECQGLALLLQDELNHPSLFWINRWLRREFEFPIVSIVHHLRSSEQHAVTHRWLYPLVERAYLNTVDYFIFNSQTTQASVTAMLGRPVSGIVAYPAGDHLPIQLGQTSPKQKNRRRANSESFPLQILCVGNVSVRKGFHTVLAALAYLPAGMAVVDIVGSQNDRAYVGLLEHQINRYNLAERVTLWGSLSDEELCERYQEADVFVMPSYEGFGIVYLEAMQHGLPVIGSTAGASHELITHGDNGFLIPPNDSEQLATHLLELHQDRPARQRMSRAARQRFDQHPTWPESMQNIHAQLVEWASINYQQER